MKPAVIPSTHTRRPQMEHIVCPRCRKDDQIQKVTAIVTGNTTVTDYTVNGYAFGSGSVVSTTQLADRLSPPERPRSKTLKEWGCFGTILVLACAMISGFTALVVIPPVTSTFLNFWMKPEISCMIGVIPPLLIPFLVAFYDAQKTRKNMPVWKRKVYNWAQLYYCYRDDCVFDPGTGKHSSPENMEKMI